MSKYTPELIRIAQEEIPSLKYDFQNASTLYSLQAACQRLLTLFEYVLHDAILDAPAAAKPAPAPAPAPATARAPVTRSPSPLNLPAPGPVSQPRSAPSVIPGMADVPIEPGATNVFVTSQGIKVIGPTGTTAALPPGAPVSLSDVTGTPELPPPPEGGVNVVLPQGGADLPPELADALSTKPSE